MRWREFQSLQRVSELGDRFLSYVDRGRGSPVVLLHGMPTWGYLWHRVMAELTGSHRVLVPDLLGFGFSDRRDRFDRSIARQAEAIDAWMERLGVERAAIVGHDLGGGVALRLAVFFPSRVERLCLLDAVAYDSWPIEAMLQLGYPVVDRRVSAPALASFLGVALRQGFAASPPAEVIEGLVAPYATEVGKLSLLRDAAALNTNLTTELTPLLPGVLVPALVLRGESDRLQTARVAERLAGDIPGARLARMPRARHYAVLERASEVAARLGAFLAERAGARDAAA